MRILIAVDSTEPALEATRVAQDLFLHDEHVIISAASIASFVITDPVPGGAFTTGSPNEALAAAQQQANDAVRSAKGVLHDVADSHVEIGAAGPVICDQAAELKADVVVVGHRSKNWLSRLFDPSVSDYVVRHSPCPVLVVRERPE